MLMYDSFDLGSSESDLLRSRSNSINSNHSQLSLSTTNSQEFVLTFLPRWMDKKYSTLVMGKSPGKSNDTEESTMYLDYPPTKPFINDDYERPPYKPVNSYPEGNRQTVISALKNLQGKIRNLEEERTAAEDNLKSLTAETNRYRDILQKDSEQKKPSQTAVSKHNQELESQLSAAETRCDLLEKQLEYMRNMVTHADKDRLDFRRKNVDLDSLQEEPVEHSSSFQNNLRKIADLEREHIKLTANQSLAESKIRELEERLGDERHHRKLIVEKAAEIESVQKANRILEEADALQECKLPQKSKRTVKKKKKTVVSKKTSHCNKPEASKHYRLNLADIPFVAGKNTGPSYSVGANVQRVFALMKSHNMALCSHASSSVNSHQSSSRRGSESSMPSTESDLAEILLQLQDEFHQMSFDHQEISKEINETSDPRLREDMERELDNLVSRMEAKSAQISKIRHHQDRVAHKKKKKSQKTEDYEESPTPQPRSARDCLRASTSPRYNGEVEVTTTIKPKGIGSGVVQIRPTSAREISLNVLKDMRKLQSTLRKDDLSWK